jgi:hypothetical protein
MRPLKNKKGASVAKAFKDIFNGGRTPNRIRTDKGQEFRAKEVQSVLKMRKIRHMFANNETKAAVSERVIKTIKTKIYRYFTFKRAYEYVNELNSFAEGYNKTVHRTIDMAPVDVTENNSEEVRVATYMSRKPVSKPPKTLRFRFKIGQHVRITHLRNVFTRQYDDKWTGEIFEVARRFWRGHVPIYRLKDYNGDEIKGTFYQSELQKVDVKDTDVWKVDEILKTRGSGRNKQHYIKWLHYPKKFNSWIKARDVEDV